MDTLSVLYWSFGLVLQRLDVYLVDKYMADYPWNKMEDGQPD